MLEKCKNTMTYSYIECKSPLSQLMLGEGLFLLFGVFAWSSAAVAAARWFCANTVLITLTARRMSAVMGYRCNRT